MKHLNIGKEKCVGCTACVNICPQHCIEMKKDGDGFSYPILNHAKVCVDCGCCEKVCPVLKKKQEKKEVPIAYATFSKNEKMRQESSSGGIFSELANVIISQGGIVYGAAYDD